MYKKTHTNGIPQVLRRTLSDKIIVELNCVFKMLNSREGGSKIQ